MNRIGYRYRLSRDVDLPEARETLLLALLAAEGLFGRTRVRMDAAWGEDEALNVLIVDAGTLVGMTACLIFTAFLTAEFGTDGFDVRQVSLRTPFTIQGRC